MDMDNSVVIAGGGVESIKRGINGDGKNTKKQNYIKKKQQIINFKRQR